MLASADDLDGATVVDCRPFAEYKKSHVPGAVNFDVFAFHWIDTTPAGLEGFAEQARQLASFVGICPGRRVVFYDGTSGMLAARGLWLAMYSGHKDARMLDGGMQAWSAAGRPLEEGTRAFEPCKFEASLDTSVIIGRGELASRLAELRIIDARSPSEYSGHDVRAARGGHIPGAINVDWTENLGPDGRFLDPAKLRSMYGPDRETVAYCHGGYRASNTFAALLSAGYSKVRVYPGSWGEWGNAPSLPVER